MGFGNQPCKQPTKRGSEVHADNTLNASIDAEAKDYWQGVAQVVEQHDEADLIRECDGVDLDHISDHFERYLLLANQKLHVFPFKDVRPCWHRLYTDASIIKAIHLVRDESSASPRRLNQTWLDEAVSVLDMAMITSGGFGREEVMEEIYERLKDIQDNYDGQSCNSKRSKLVDQLPTEIHSIPKIVHHVQHQLHQPTLTSFEKSIRTIKQPILLTGILENWPALSNWQSRKHWNALTLGGRRLVPVETGRSYVDDDWGQSIIPFRTFLDDYIFGEAQQKGYLAQYDLFHHIPDLNRDIATPDYCFLDAPDPDPGTPVAKARMKSGLKSSPPPSRDVQKNIWFGPAWTISPLHHDPYHNILCQVAGKKYLRLYSPGDSSKLYPRAVDEPAPHGEGTIDMSNTSSVDVASMELSPLEDWDEKWPGISTIPYQEIVLEAGQALYIPIGWWHYVRSCSVGISVSFWW